MIELAINSEDSAIWDSVNFDEETDEVVEEILRTSTGDEEGIAMIDFDEEMDDVLFMNIGCGDEEDDRAFQGESSLLLGLIDDGDEAASADCELPSFDASASSSEQQETSSASRPSTPAAEESEDKKPSKSRRSSLVTPEPQSPASSVSTKSSSLNDEADPEFLQRQFHETLKKLAESMKQSDASRSMVKKQLKSRPELRKVFTDKKHKLKSPPSDFFLGKKYQEVLNERKRLMKMIAREDSRKSASSQHSQAA